MMGEVVSATDLRDHSAEILENVNRGRVLIRKYGKDHAYLISVREIRSLDETVAVLENDELIKSISVGLSDIKAGRVQDADEVFAELDAEFSDEE